ncbi:succinylarginine dihydrolase, partial [bacterium]|nr:succinylarginine dihydrolase [bacterium]
ELIIHRHRLNPDSVLMLKQSETVIDAGVFHNDVIATGHDGLYFMHHSAYTVAPAVVRKWLWTQDQNYELIVFDSGELSLNDVVASYWFNSQLVTAGDGRRMMLAPVQARGVSNDAHIAARFLAAGISEIRWVELDESLKNGGGPACVRLRVPLTPLELGTVCASLLMTPDTLDMLEDWVNSYYRDCLIPDDLATASVIDEGYLALDELTRLLNLGKIYDFQLL